MEYQIKFTKKMKDLSPDTTAIQLAEYASKQSLELKIISDYLLSIFISIRKIHEICNKLHKQSKGARR